MHISKEQPWGSTLFGAAAILAGGLALGREWTKLRGCLTILGVAVPITRWFSYFTRGIEDLSTAEQWEWFEAGWLDNPGNLATAAQSSDLNLFKHLLEHQLQKAEGRTERFKKIQEHANAGPEKAGLLLAQAVKYPELISSLEKPDDDHMRDALHEKWNPEAVSLLAQQHYTDRPETFLTLVPLEQVVWCYENCWTEDHPAESDDSLQRFLLSQENLKKIVGEIGAEKLEKHLGKSFDLCIRCYWEVPDLRNAAGDALPVDVKKQAFTKTNGKYKLKKGYSFTSETFSVLSKWGSVKDLCLLLLDRKQVEDSERIDRFACAVWGSRSCGNNEQVPPVFEDQLADWFLKYPEYVEQFWNAITVDDRALTWIAKAKPKLLRALWSLDEGPNVWKAFRNVPAALGEVLRTYEFAGDQPTELGIRLCDWDFFGAVWDHLPKEVSGWKDDMRAHYAQSQSSKITWIDVSKIEGDQGDIGLLEAASRLNDISALFDDLRTTNLNLSSVQAGIVGVETHEDPTARIQELHKAFQDPGHLSAKPQWEDLDEIRYLVKHYGRDKQYRQKVCKDLQAANIPVLSVMPLTWVSTVWRGDLKGDWGELFAWFETCRDMETAFKALEGDGVHSGYALVCDQVHLLSLDLLARLYHVYPNGTYRDTLAEEVKKTLVQKKRGRERTCSVTGAWKLLPMVRNNWACLSDCVQLRKEGEAWLLEEEVGRLCQLVDTVRRKGQGRKTVMRLLGEVDVEQMKKLGVWKKLCKAVHDYYKKLSKYTGKDALTENEKKIFGPFV